jgi:uncharacterized protein involved in outer membrane biogenesis
MPAPARATWAGFPRRHPVWSGLLGSLLLLLLLLLLLMDWNWAKGPVQRLVSGMTEREFRIDGDLDVDLFPLEISAGQVYFGNASWSEDRTMARIDQLDMRVRFWPLLVGRVTVPQLYAERPRLLLERNVHGVGNWSLADAPRDCPPGECRSRLRVLQLLVKEGRLRFREPTYETSIDAHLDSVAPATDDALAPLVFSGEGTYRSARFELEGVVDSPLALRDGAQPYRLDVRARAGDTHARASGLLAEPLQIQEVSLEFELQGTNLADLYRFAGIVLPMTPPYSLRGRLRRSGNRFAYEDFSGTVGDSDLAGDAWFQIGGQRPGLTADLKSDVIDFDDLAGFVGGTPGTGAGETDSAEQRRQAGTQKATGRLLPVRPVDLDRLRAMDADVRLAAARVDARRLPLESMQAHLVLKDGVLKIEPFAFAAAGGQLDSIVQVDARHDPASFALDLRLRDLQLPQLMPRVKQMRDALGSISGVIKLQGEGNSAAKVLGSADGQFGMIMGPGRMSNLLLEVAGLDIAEALAFVIGKDRQVRLRCAYADFGLEDGVATARSVAVDTTDTALLLRGEIDFRDESLDLTLVPKPKDASPVSIRTPIRIRGTFADPDVDLKGGPLLLRGAAVAALAAIAPPLALLGLVETGPGDDTRCGRDTAVAQGQ